MVGTGSFAFSGEGCRISLLKKGDAGSVEVEGRLVGGNLSGFQRGTSMERTFGTHLTSYSGFGEATIDLAFVYDEEDSVDPFISYVGSQATSSGITKNVLVDRQKPDLYKLKVELNEYSDSFGALAGGDRVVRIVFYNVFGVGVSTNLTPEGEVSGGISFTVNPFNHIGSSNYLELEKESGDTIANLNSVESSYDSDMGY